MPSKNLRTALHALMAATVADEIEHHNWTYWAVRPMSVPASWSEGEHVTGDCSKGVQFLNHWVGGPDPMGNGYGPYGNSQTIWLKLQHLGSARDLQVGDIVTFGHDGEQHAAMVYEAASAENGWDPLMWSWGHQGAPNFYRLSQDRREKQFLRNPIPKYTPTPEDRLRARTGWFAWVAWRLGEGDWRHHGEANPAVRPAVPKRIPPSWWRRYVKFLAARKRANKPT